MARRSTKLAGAKANPSERPARAERGEEGIVTKQGKPGDVLTPVRSAKRPIDVEATRAILATLPKQPEGASDLVRRMRDDDGY